MNLLSIIKHYFTMCMEESASAADAWLICMASDNDWHPSLIRHIKGCAASDAHTVPFSVLQDAITNDGSLVVSVTCKFVVSAAARAPLTKQTVAELVHRQIEAGGLSAVHVHHFAIIDASSK